MFLGEGDSNCERGVAEFVAVLPHPGPLPRGEGDALTAFVFQGRQKQFERWLTGSQRERAGVRESVCPNPWHPNPLRSPRLHPRHPRYLRANSVSLFPLH
jgi:hypothetical protein